MQQRWCSGHAEQQRQNKEECVPDSHLGSGPARVRGDCSHLSNHLQGNEKLNSASSNAGRDDFKILLCFQDVFDDSGSATGLDAINATAATKSLTGPSQDVGRRKSACQADVGTETCLATLKKYVGRQQERMGIDQ